MLTQAPFGGAATGANPTDHGQRGTKRRPLCEGHGLPLAVVVAGANRHDMQLVEATLHAVVVERPQPSTEQELCVDAGYDHDKVREQVRTRGDTPHICLRDEDRANAGSPDPAKWPRQWVVERLHRWRTRSRRLLVR